MASVLLFAALTASLPFAANYAAHPHSSCSSLLSSLVRAKSQHIFNSSTGLDSDNARRCALAAQHASVLVVVPATSAVAVSARDASHFGRKMSSEVAVRIVVWG